MICFYYVNVYLPPLTQKAVKIDVTDRSLLENRALNLMLWRINIHRFETRTLSASDTVL